MTITTLILEVDDTAVAETFYRTLGVEKYVDLRSAGSPSEGFRGFTVSLICSQPANVDAIVAEALRTGATQLKPPAKSFWGYGGVIQAPDGTIWKVASSSKKSRTPAAREFDDIVLLLGVEDVKASKRFYVDRGLSVAKSFGGKYVEFASEPIKLALYPRRASAKDAGVTPEGSGPHRLVVGATAGDFTDPDGYVWQNR